MTTRRISSGLTSAGGVALADILANSVAVLLILIFLSISVKQEQADKQVEQTVDLSILMARKLADSVVLNALPSSRPAYLHDYHSCDIPHDCEPYLYPIIEIYDNYTRIFNTNQLLNRAALLKPTNALDEYLSTLDFDQINNIRIDIYGIGMFYLTISTLREYNAPLRHWHFLGEKAQTPFDDSKESGTKNNEIAQLLEQGKQGLTDNDAENGDQNRIAPMPTGVDIINPQQLAGLEEENLLLPPENLEATANLNDQAGEEQQEQGLLAELLEGFRQSRDADNANKQELATSGNMRYQLRLPNVSPPANSDPVELDIDQDQVRLMMLTFLFMAMEVARKNNYFDPEELSNLFFSLVENPESYRKYQLHSLIRDIDTILKQLSESPKQNINLSFTNERTAGPVQLSLTANSATKSLTLSGNALIEGQDELLLAGISQIDVLLRLYPFVYRGDRASISADMLMLMHPQDFSLRGNRWYPIALVSRDLQQMTLGFIYGSYKSGKLMIPVDINQIRAQSVILQSDFGQPPKRTSWQIAIAFGISGLIVLIILVTIIRSSLRLARRRDS